MPKVTFEIFEAAINGAEPEDMLLDEGVIGRLRNYLSRATGGKVAKIDKLVKDFTEEQIDWIDKWAMAHAKVNGYTARRSKVGADTLDRAKFQEMVDRSRAYLKKLEDNKDEMEEEYRHTAKKLCGNSDRLNDYFMSKNGEAMKEVRERITDKLEGYTDKSQIDKVFAETEDDIKRGEQAEQRLITATAGASTGPQAEEKREAPKMDPETAKLREELLKLSDKGDDLIRALGRAKKDGDYEKVKTLLQDFEDDLSDENAKIFRSALKHELGRAGFSPSQLSKMQTLADLGIASMFDFIFSQDDLFYKKVDVMTKANLKSLLSAMEREVGQIQTTVKTEMKKLRSKELKHPPLSAEGMKEKNAVEQSARKAEKAAQEDLDVLQDRIEAVRNKIETEVK